MEHHVESKPQDPGSAPSTGPSPKALAALHRGTARVIDLRNEELHWEGEVVWNAMLAAQYTIAMWVMGRPLSDERRRNIRTQFEVTRLEDGSGLWGLHPHGEASLFVTTLVYIAARSVGLAADDPLLAPARAFFAAEDVLAIPTWGKVWLSIAGLYEWEGVHAVPPETWLLPSELPVHPANYYCHTRLIYAGVASAFGRRLRAAPSALTSELRTELYPGRSYAELDFGGSKSKLREADLWQPPSKLLGALYAATDAHERVRGWIPALGDKVRRRSLDAIEETIRWELETTDYTCLSPVNGLLFALSLWHIDPSDPMLDKQLEAFEGWIWEDAAEGLRVSGARSATWDSAFVLQALVVGHDVLEGETRERSRGAIAEGLEWLATQQIRETFPGYQKQHRVDPKGGFCFAGVWHGWPVSDCSAEAMLAFLDVDKLVSDFDEGVIDERLLEDAARFLMQCQNYDGGFGSYEARKNRVDLEALNPAEMFGDSMTELSYVECTASCAAALASFATRLPASGVRFEAKQAVRRAEEAIRALQLPDGSWPGVWGVGYLYGTMFGIRGLLAAGAGPRDPAVLKAAAYLRSKQRADGSFGEHWKSCLEDRYVDLSHGHVTQTAWALIGLLEASEGRALESGERESFSRAAAWLAAAQLEDGDWPEQEMVGIFFRTALLDYRLYRRIFPVWALGLYATRLQHD